MTPSLKSCHDLTQWLHADFKRNRAGGLRPTAHQTDLVVPPNPSPGGWPTKMPWLMLLKAPGVLAALAFLIEAPRGPSDPVPCVGLHPD